MKLEIFLILPLVFNYGTSLNILGIFPFRGKSHFIVQRIYLLELARRGHNVTVISHFPEEDPPKNYHDISLAGSIDEMEYNRPLYRSYYRMFETGVLLMLGGRETCEAMVTNNEVQHMIRSKPKFDVAVIEQFHSDCGLGLAYKLNTPVVGLTSLVLMPYYYSRVGMPYNPAYVPFFCLSGGTKPTIIEKLQKIVLDIFLRTSYYYLSQRSDQNILARYFDDIPSLEDLAREIKFMLVNQNFILTGTRLLPSNVIEVAGYHVQESKPLQGDLRKFAEEAEHGVIYISFGTFVNSSSLPNEKFEAIMGAIRKLSQRFIWKHHNKTLLLSENKLYVGDWLPQTDILGHPNTVAFFSHAGMAGTTEALHFGVPMVAMPILGDQPSNAAAIEKRGLGVQLDMWDLTTDSLVDALKKVMDPQFRANVKLLSKMWRDRPMSPLDTAVYWTEYAARYSNFTFRTPAADVKWYQYTNLDIIAVSITILTLVVLAVKIALRLFHWKQKKEDNKNNKLKSM